MALVLLRERAALCRCRGSAAFWLEGQCAPSLLAERGASAAGCCCPPGTPAVSRKVCACRAFWRSAALPRQGWVSASVWRACARRVFGQSAAPPRHSPPSLPFPSRAWRFGAAPLGLAPLAPRLLAGSRGTAVRVTTLPFPMPTQAAPRVPFPCLRTRALGWSVLRWWGFPSYVVPWSPSLLAAPLGSPLAGSGRLGLG